MKKIYEPLRDYMYIFEQKTCLNDSFDFIHIIITIWYYYSMAFDGNGAFSLSQT